MKLENNIIKHYLKNTYFITGTAYAGKSTMVKMLADRYDMIACEENYHMNLSSIIAEKDIQPNLCYFQTMSGWQEFLGRTPKEYDRWIIESAREAAEFEVANLIQLSASGKKVIVDTNIPLELLHEIADYHQVAVMLSPQSMSVEHFFDRNDPEKLFLLQQLEAMEHPSQALNNFKECIAEVNSQAHYSEYQNSGFFTILREHTNIDTKESVLTRLVEHFGLCKG